MLRWPNRVREAQPLLATVAFFKNGMRIRAIHVVALDWPKVDLIYPQIPKITSCLF